jgi:hypothetical protein
MLYGHIASLNREIVGSRKLKIVLAKNYLSCCVKLYSLWWTLRTMGARKSLTYEENTMLYGQSARLNREIVGSRKVKIVRSRNYLTCYVKLYYQSKDRPQGYERNVLKFM